jgi:hypothetical protein
MDLGIPPENLKLLGRFYQNDLCLDVVEDDNCISIVPPKNASNAIRNLTIVLAMLASVLCGTAGWLFSLKTDESLLSRVFTYSLFVLVWLCAVIGPYIGNTHRIRYLLSISPLLSFCRESGIVSVHGQNTRKLKDDVIAIIGLASCGDDSEKKTELQIIARDGEAIRQYLVATSIFGTIDGVFKNQIKRFSEFSGIPGFVVDQTKKTKVVTTTVRPI